jgi:hypothetical protein
VVDEHPRLGCDANGGDSATVEGHAVVGGDALSEFGGLAIHGDAALRNPLFDLPSRANANARQNLLQLLWNGRL